MKTNRLTALAVAVSSVFALSASAGEAEMWNVTFEADSFQAGFPGLTMGELGTLTNDETKAQCVQPYASGVWTAIDSDESYVTNGLATNWVSGAMTEVANATYLKLDTQGNDLTWTPTETTNGVQTLVDVDLFLVGSDSAPTDFDASHDVQAAIYLKNLTDDAPGGSGDTTNSVLCVYVYDEGIESNVWVTLAGTELVDNSWAHVQVSVDHTGDKPKVSVKVNGTQMNASDDATSTSWTAANYTAASATKINSVSFRGTGAVDNFVGKYVEEEVAYYDFTAEVYIGTELQNVDDDGNMSRLAQHQEVKTGSTVPFDGFANAEYDGNGDLAVVLSKIVIIDPVTGAATATFNYTWDDVDEQVVPDTDDTAYVTFRKVGGYQSGPFSVTAPTADAVSNAVVAKIYFTDLSEPTTYDITFYDWDNTQICTTSVVANATGYGPATDPVRANYTFDGWTNAVVGGPLYATADLPAAVANATYTAVYSESATPPEPTPVNPGSNLKPQDIANGVKPIDVTPAGFVVNFRGEAGMTYELLATDDLSITEAQWKALTPVDTEDCTVDDDLITLTAPMTEDAQFFKIGVSVTTP